MSEPTAQELERRLETDRERLARERQEMRQEMQDGFTELKMLISQLDVVSREVFQESQQRQDAEANRLESELTWIRRVMVLGFLATLVAAVVVQMIAPNVST